MSDHKPKNIIEFGLGESSKIIAAFLKNELHTSKHTIVEHDENWINIFNMKSLLSGNSKILHLPSCQNIVNGYQVTSYSDIEKAINEEFDLYVVDGPFGSKNFSRYDICLLAKKIQKDHEFIIIMDDYNRQGEVETSEELIKILDGKGIKTYIGYYSGEKAQLVIATERYRLATTM